jgi:hypothetical protein
MGNGLTHFDSGDFTFDCSSFQAKVRKELIILARFFPCEVF